MLTKSYVTPYKNVEAVPLAGEVNAFRDESQMIHVSGVTPYIVPCKIWKF